MPSQEATASGHQVQRRRPVQRALKRGFDLLSSSLVVLVTLPLWAAVALLIRMESPGPVLYRGPRMGRGAKPFHIYKFRSMIVEAPQPGLPITGRGDPRITRVGRWLRTTKLDELPQLINVLKGEMSIIGPRPEDPRYVAHYPEEYRRLLTVRPGLASPATLKYRHEEALLAKHQNAEEFYLNVILPDKLKLDIEYVEGFSLWWDSRLIWRTALALFRRSR